VTAAGGADRALARGALPLRCDVTLSEAVVLGLLRQGVERFIVVLGHGTTDLGEVLRVYEAEGALRTYAVRNEVEASHAATALAWTTGRRAAVVTSIGPGALQAMAGSLAAASDGIGVYYLMGDETTQDEGPNMQQVPKHEQDLFLRLASTLGNAYTLHTPEAVGTALGRGATTVFHPWREGPFYLLLPMNTQPAILPRFNLAELPEATFVQAPVCMDESLYLDAVAALAEARRVVVKVGFGAQNAGLEVEAFLEAADAVAVHTPIATGIVPYGNPRNMGVGGSKGSICGNWAMENADLLVAVGTRGVCQSDCSRTGYPNVRKVITINADPYAATHYGSNVPLIGDAGGALVELTRRLLEPRGGARPRRSRPSEWLSICTQKKAEWQAFKQARYDCPTLPDPVWGREVLTQVAAIKCVTDWAKSTGAVCFFDAGDVQANGFQVVEDDRPGRTITETGASYMGFAASALLATNLTGDPFYGVALTGDGSFVMNPQVLIDGVLHRATGCIVLMDNRRMGAISGLQAAQYGKTHATWDHVPVDYVAWASSVRGVAAFHGGYSVASLAAALAKAKMHEGLSLIHVPVYYGDHPLGGLGAFGRWNVGSWVEATQKMRHDIGL
jgi:3D-(3,5/4)-trihydroxycyclohexane-1,2-dione acylhydrolase (decyclizing)